MSRYRLLTIIVVLLVFLEGGCTKAETSTPAEASKDKVLLILQEQSEDMQFMIKNEVGVMVDMLEKAGFDVVFASPSGKSLGGGDTTLTPDLILADVKVDDYAGLILPCMAVPLDLPRDPDAIRVVKEAAALGKPIAAQLGGILTLSDAGVVEEKKLAMLSEGVFQDGNIITSGICPFMAKMGEGTDGTPELTQKFIDALESTP